MLIPIYNTPLWCSRGHFNKDQADKYESICNCVEPKYALEIGFCTGRSAACVLYYAARSLIKMISIEKDLDYSKYGRSMAALLTTKFCHFSIAEQSSGEILNNAFFSKEFSKGLDIVTIDGDHSYEQSLFDLTAVAPFLNENGVIIVDDYLSGPPNGIYLQGVNDSVNYFLSLQKTSFQFETWNVFGKEIG